MTVSRSEPPFLNASLQRLLCTSLLGSAQRPRTPRVKPSTRKDYDSKSLPPAPNPPLFYEHDPAGFEYPSAPALLKRKRTTISPVISRSSKSSFSPGEKLKASPSLPAVEYEDENGSSQIPFLPPRHTSTVTSSTAEDTPWDTNISSRASLPSHFATPTVCISPLPAEPLGGQFKVQSVAPSSPKRRVSAAGASAATPDYTSRKPWAALTESASRAGRSRWAAAVICATSRRLEAPSGRYVSEILAALREGGKPSDKRTAVGAVFQTLQGRLDSKSWVVALKATVTMHAILRVGNPKFVTYVAERHDDLFESLFSVEVCGGGKEGRRRSKFVQGYVTYLEKWLRMRRDARFPMRAGESVGASRFAKCRGVELLYVLHRVLDTLDAVQEVKVRGNVMNCEIIKVAVGLILRDTKTLMAGLQAGFTRLVDVFHEMENRQTIPALALYARFVRVVGQVGSTVKKLRADEGALSSIAIPEGLMTRMRACVEKKRRSSRDLRGNLSLVSYRPAMDFGQEEDENDIDVSEESEDKDVEGVFNCEYREDEEDSVSVFELKRIQKNKNEVLLDGFLEWSDSDDAKYIRLRPLPTSVTPFPSQLIRSMRPN